MAGSGFGTNFRITTWGETHGAGVGVVVDGCPTGLPLERRCSKISGPQKTRAVKVYNTEKRRRSG